ncbi:tail fiber protein [Yersinia similis]|uniref:tail fiber protein n=1 Tax=Yersinia similis TaxID=367190 RepID=UPI00119D2E17|nr:phage tail protein [Yersinia similis]
MYGLDNTSGISVMPPVAPAVSPTPLWFTEGGAGQSPSYPGQDWFNMFQAEHLNVLADAGISPDKSKLNQLATAIKKLIATGLPEIPVASLSQKGIVQLSSAINSDSETLAATSKAVKTASEAALKIEKNLSDLNDTTLARTNIGAADANDVVSKKNGGTFDKSIDVKGVVTSREKVECRSPANDNYSSGFNCYITDNGVITDYISTHYAIAPQWLFSTKLELTTRKVTLSVNGDIKSGGTITAGGEGGAQIYRDGNITGTAWEPIGDLFSYINSIKSGAITSVRLGAQSSSDGAIGPIPAGCYLVGTSGNWNVFRPLQFLQNGTWVTAGNI